MTPSGTAFVSLRGKSFADERDMEDIFYTFLSFIIQSSTYAVFPLVSVRHKIKSISLSSANDFPLRDTKAVPEGVMSLYSARL
jgi:hypothetical protein